MYYVTEKGVPGLTVNQVTTLGDPVASRNSLSGAEKQYVLSLKDAFDAYDNSGE